jgi:O-antigen ligase
MDFVTSSHLSRDGNAKELTSAATRCLSEAIVFWSFCAGLTWAPFWLGGTGLLPWGVNAILFPGLVLVYEMSLVWRGQTEPVAVKWIAVPFAATAAVLIWTMLQTATWVPTSLQNPIWQMAADVIHVPAHGRISVNPDATMLAMLRLLTAASVFWLSLQLCRDARRAVQLFKVMAFIVVGYTIWAFLSAMVLPDRTLWFPNPGASAALSSTFYNRNSYATYSGIGLILMTAVCLQHYREEAARAGIPFRHRIASILETTGRSGAVMIGSIVILAVGLLGTGSRGAFISTAFAFFVLAALSARSKQQRREQRLTIVAVALLLVALFTAFGNEVLGNLEINGVQDQSRIDVWKATIDSIATAPSLGFGYGTFEDVFPMFRTHLIAPLMNHWAMAHDTYLEILQGLGVVFGALLIGAVGWISSLCLKGATTREMNLTVPRAAFSISMLVSLHSLADFSMQIQGITVTVMAILGAGTAQAFSSRVRTSE